MKLKIGITLLAVTFSSLALAGVAETKAKRSADEVVAAEVATLMENCGNAEFQVQFAWDEFDAVLETEKSKIEDRDDKNEWILEKAGDRTAQVVTALARICEEDADYKAEIAKLTGITVKPKSSYEDYTSEFTLDGTTIMADTGFQMNRSPSDFTDRLMELF